MVPFLSGQERLLSQASRQMPGPIQPTIQQLPGGLPVGIKQVLRETDQSALSSAEVNNYWTYISTPQIHLCGMCGGRFTHLRNMSSQSP
jgi:hypothetical protein